MNLRERFEDRQRREIALRNVILDEVQVAVTVLTLFALCFILSL